MGVHVPRLVAGLGGGATVHCGTVPSSSRVLYFTAGWPVDSGLANVPLSMGIMSECAWLEPGVLGVLLQKKNWRANVPIIQARPANKSSRGQRLSGDPHLNGQRKSRASHAGLSLVVRPLGAAPDAGISRLQPDPGRLVTHFHEIGPIAYGSLQ